MFHLQTGEIQGCTSAPMLRTRRGPPHPLRRDSRHRRLLRCGAPFPSFHTPAFCEAALGHIDGPGTRKLNPSKPPASFGQTNLRRTPMTTNRSLGLPGPCLSMWSCRCPNRAQNWLGKLEISSQRRSQLAPRLGEPTKVPREKSWRVNNQGHDSQEGGHKYFLASPIGSQCLAERIARMSMHVSRDSNSCCSSHFFGSLISFGQYCCKRASITETCCT